ncbi:MAG TPA: NADP-dependent oxidoreductase [Deinococcales bacterium]|nr:NADP-dependent oxidoreductase [Deinococcales bacterium]
MKAFQIFEFGGPGRVVDVPVPQPGPGDLLVKVAAAGLNPVDNAIRRGQMQALLPLALPLTLGSELSGTVEALGEGVQGFAVGDRVYARLDKRRIGTLAEYALVGAADAARAPESLSFEQAAGIPLAGLTAWQALTDLGEVKRGQKVLIHAGAGGVGSLGIQLARHLGAWTATTVSARNLELARSLGADEAIDYHARDFAQELPELDFVLDTVGRDTLERSIPLVKPGGTLVTIYGSPTPQVAESMGATGEILNVLRERHAANEALAAARGVRYLYWFMRPDGRQLAELAGLADAGELRAVTDSVYPLQDAEAAFAHLAEGHATGKVIVRVGE